MAEHMSSLDGRPLEGGPGTVRLISKRLPQSDGDETAAAAGSVILIPTPTSSPNDPLNWSKGLKTWVSANLLLWTFLANASIAWTSPAWAVWTEDLRTDYTLLGYGQGLLVLCCGIGVLFLQPLALKYGRRPVYMIGSLLIIAGLLCGLFMTSAALFLAYMALSGIGSAPSYSTIVTSLLDMSFLHQKGFALGLYGFVLIFGNFLPPLAAGYIVDAQGWEWCFHYLLIFFGLSTLLVLFAVEETSFARHTVLSAACQTLQGQAPGSTPVAQHVSASKAANEQQGLKPRPSNIQPPEPRQERLPYLQRMTLWRPNDDVKAPYWRVVLAMLDVAILPAASWASIQLAVSTLVVSLIMTTQASFFAAPPYDFTPSQMGLMYLPLLAGAVIGSALGGPATDWLLLRLARRNEGIHEPEARLWSFVPVSFLAVASVLLYGLGAVYGLHWVIPCIGLFFVGVYMNLAFPVCLGYALDCYPDLEDEIVQLSNFIRNVVGGATTFGIQPWITNSGPRNTTIAIALIVFAAHLTSVGFQIWGKSIRVKGASRYHKICETQRRWKLYQ